MIGIINKKKKQGFSLIELVVAISIFSIITVIALDSFLNIIRINRETVDQQNLQNHVDFLYEMMMKEIKMAVVSNNQCGFATTGVYRTNANKDALYFQNYHGNCVVYQLNNNKLEISRDGGSSFVQVFPSNIQVNKILFKINKLITDGQVLHSPPAVTISMELQSTMWKNPIIKMESSVVARYLE